MADLSDTRAQLAGIPSSRLATVTLSSANGCQLTLEEPLDPITAPLTYPGAAPRSPAVLVTEFDVLDVHPSQPTPLGEWRVRLSEDEDRPLDQVLLEHEAMPIADRIPVLAVGSNAAPAQVRRKLATTGLA